MSPISVSIVEQSTKPIPGISSIRSFLVDIDGAKPFDKYGGYDIQDEFFDFEDNYIGTYNNVAGFPLNILIDILNELNLTMNN